MSLVAIVFSRCHLIALGAFFLVAPMASVSQADVVAADTFTRADTGSGGADDLGITEVGDFAWVEHFIQNPFGDPGTAEILNGELKLTPTHGTAFIDVGLSDLTASADLRISGVGAGDYLSSYMHGFLLRISDPEVVPYFEWDDNLGLVMAHVTSGGGMLIGENTTGDDRSFGWYYQDNPFFEGEVAWDGFPPPGRLPTEINGAPFDANGNGRLEDDEPFLFGAVLSGTNIDVQINGETIKSATLENTSGISANGFSLMRHGTGGGFENFPHFDNLIIEGNGNGGDFDMDGDVDGNDTLLAQLQPDGAAAIATAQAGYGTGVGAVSAVGAVPEPSTLALLSLALGAVSLRRSRS